MGKQITDHLGHRYSTISEICKIHGISYITLRTRLRAGWSLEKALATKVKYLETRDTQIGYQ